MWLLAGLLNRVQKLNIDPKDAALFERFCLSITGAQVRTRALLQRVLAFTALTRRKTLLSEFSNLSEDHKDRLLKTSIFAKDVFDPETLETVIKEHVGDVTSRNSETLVKAMASSLSNLKRARVDRPGSNAPQTGPRLAQPKASTSVSSPPVVGARQRHNKGKGRGDRGGKSGGGQRGGSRGFGNPKKDFRN